MPFSSSMIFVTCAAGSTAVGPSALMSVNGGSKRRSGGHDPVLRQHLNHEFNELDLLWSQLAALQESVWVAKKVSKQAAR